MLWKNLVLKGTHSHHNTNSTNSYRHRNRGFVTATLVRFPLSASHAIPRGVSLNRPKTTTFWFMCGVEWDIVEKSQTSEPSSNDGVIMPVPTFRINMLPPSSWTFWRGQRAEYSKPDGRYVHIEGRGECSQSQLRRGKRGEIVYRPHCASSSHFNIHLNLIHSPWIWWQHVLAKYRGKLIIPHLITTQTIIIAATTAAKTWNLTLPLWVQYWAFPAVNLQVLSVLFVRSSFSLHASVLQYENGALHSTARSSHSTARTINQVTHNVLHTPAPP